MTHEVRNVPETAPLVRDSGAQAVCHLLKCYPSRRGGDVLNPNLSINLKPHMLSPCSVPELSPRSTGWYINTAVPWLAYLALPEGAAVPGSSAWSRPRP